MKRTHLIAIVMLAVAAGLLIMSSANLSSYSTFTKAANSGKTAKVVGFLAKEMPMTYNPEEDPNFFSFYMKDEEGKMAKVIIKEPKRQDFERTESIVLTGKMVGDEFHATDMLLKCPSKYKDEELALRKKVS
jgi:cytochrome c-type biogenesis protein CcmE